MPDLGERELIHHGSKFDFERVRLHVPAGAGAPARVLEREVVRHPGAVVILPIMEDGSIVFIRNFRVAVGESLWELPAGTIEPPEPALACAERELAEETGYRTARIEPIARFLTTPGLTDELMHAFVATGLFQVGASPEEAEMISVEPAPFSEALAMIDDGRLTDAKSILAILLALRRGLIPGSGS